MIVRASRPVAVSPIVSLIV